MSRFQFYRRNQQSRESISVFIKELETMFRDRLICSVLDESLQRSLLSEKDLSFTKAEEVCLAHEVANGSLSM